jgi:hypothetical protein
VFERPLGLLRDIDLAFPEPLNQVSRGKVDQFDRLGPVEYLVGHGLADADTRDLGDDVVQAFDVLDIDRRVDVNAAVQNLFDVEVALRMTAAGRIGVREFIDKRDLRPARDDRIEVHFLERSSFVIDVAARNDLKAFEQRLGFLPTVGLDDTHDDVITVLLPRPRGLQHRVGLADTGGRTDEDAKPAGAALLAPGSLQQGFRRRPLI